MMDDEEVDLRNVLQIASQFNYKYGYDLFDNHAYRERIQIKNLARYLNIPIEEIIWAPEGRSGPDFTSTMLSIRNGELKSFKYSSKTGIITKSNLGKMVWDKQNDPLRREETLKSDFYGFLLWDQENACEKVQIFFRNSAIDIINCLIQKYQQNKIEQFERNSREGKRGRDSIEIPVYDILTQVNNPDDVIILIDHKRISLEQFLSTVKK